MRPTAFDLLERVRQQKPVVHHLTNWVTIYDCAQAVKSLGASPVMAHAREEVADMVQIASALVLNIGTLTPEMIEAMKLAARGANGKGVPVILDVCGAGATALRDQKCLELLDDARINVIKGNASEIARVSGESVRTKGVDATEVAGDLAVLAGKLARRRNATVVITGKEDIVTDGQKTYLVGNGHVMMTQVVGTGCMAASVIGAFAAVERNLALAAACALVCYGVAGEIAAEKAAGPASFKDGLLDALYHLDRATVDRRQRLKA
jgi:hydroxyethylthiazole kinase